MSLQIKPFLFLSALFLASQVVSDHGEVPSEVDQAKLEFLAEMFQVKLEVLSDFVHSYDFKCPKSLSHQDLVTILSMDEEETELSVMQESDKLGWRDTYLEARSNIECIHEGVVSSPY